MTRRSPSCPFWCAVLVAAGAVLVGTCAAVGVAFGWLAYDGDEGT